MARVFYAATDLGVANHMSRTLARDPARAPKTLGLFVAFRTAFVPLAAAIASAIALASDNGNVVLFAFVALTHGVISVQGVYEALLLSHERTYAAATLTIATSVAVAVFCALWYLLHGTLSEFGLGYAIASAIGLCVWVAWEKHVLRVRPIVRLDLSAIRDELRDAWPIGMSVLLSIAALRAPVLVLGALRSDADVGAFSAVDMIVTASGILQNAVSNASYPRLAAAYRSDRQRFRALFWRSNALLAALGTAIALFLVTAGGRVIAAAFPSKDFIRVIPLMGVIGWSTPCLFLAHHNIFVFAAADLERVNVRFMIAWAAIIGCFQLALVPTYGLAGAAWGVLVGRAVGLAVLLALLFASPILRPRDVNA